MPTTLNPQTASGTTYEAFVTRLIGYLQSNEKLYKKDLPGIFPEYSDYQRKAYTKRAALDGKIVQGQEGFQGPWFIRIPTEQDERLGFVGHARRNLAAEMPPKVLDYLAAHQFLTLDDFKKEFKISNTAVARKILKDMVDAGQLSVESDPRPGRRNVAYRVAEAPRVGTPVASRKVFVRNASVLRAGRPATKFLQTRQGVLEFLANKPEGERQGAIAEAFDVNRNDTTLISVLKDLVKQGQVIRHEESEGHGRKVTYRLAEYAPMERPIQRTVMATIRPVATAPAFAPAPEVDERDAVVEQVLARYEEILDLVESLKQQLAERDERLEALEAQLSTFREAALAHQQEEAMKPAAPISRPLPANLQERLQRLQERDRELTSETPLGQQLRERFTQKGTPTNHESCR